MHRNFIKAMKQMRCGGKKQGGRTLVVARNQSLEFYDYEEGGKLSLKD